MKVRSIHRGLGSEFSARNSPLKRAAVVISTPKPSRLLPLPNYLLVRCGRGISICESLLTEGKHLSHQKLFFNFTVINRYNSVTYQINPLLIYVI